MANRRRVFDKELWAHFVTFTCYKRRKLLDHDQPKRNLLGVLNEQLRIQLASCIGFVIMTNHVHAIVWFLEPAQLSKFMQGWKRKSSFHIRNWYRQHTPNYAAEFDSGDKFWRTKYHSCEIETRYKLLEKIYYMHLNPVRAGFVEKAVDWRWSSARWYEDRVSVGVPIE